MEDLQEEGERELVEVVDLVQIVDGEVDGAASRGQRHVLLRRRLDLAHDGLRLLGLLRDLGGLTLQRLQRRDDRVVVQDSTLGLVENLTREGQISLGL